MPMYNACIIPEKQHESSCTGIKVNIKNLIYNEYQSKFISPCESGIPLPWFRLGYTKVAIITSG
jgi:hypothetical protein